MNTIDKAKLDMWKAEKRIFYEKHKNNKKYPIANDKGMSVGFKKLYPDGSIR
jgi:hypothetical protein